MIADGLLKDVNEYSNIEQMAIQDISQDSWDEFYKHNQDKFFKNRNYLTFAFDLINQRIQELKEGGKLNLFEVGSGTGNTIMPLHERYNKQINFYACDFSHNAVKLLQSQGICQKAFVKDMVTEELHEFDQEEIINEENKQQQIIPEIKLDFVTMIFFLSAIHPQEHKNVVQKLADRMNLGGVILFRDYGLFDLAMMRFIKKKKGIIDLQQMIFQRGDKTLACFFTMEQIIKAMKESGLECISQDYCTIETKNIKRELTMRRVFINAIFQKVQ
eukprot:403368679